MRALRHIVIALFLGAGLLGCATYYDKTRVTESALVSGNYHEAEMVVKRNRFLKRRRNELLYHLELGRLQRLQGKFESSNKSLNRADRLMENHRNLLQMSVGATVNPAMQPYEAEGHERILVHYYKALNYLQLGDLEAAVVEARRMDLKQERNDQEVKGKAKKYGKDPFGLLLMGMIYEAERDYNNAFIAYRNAKGVYERDQTGLFKGKQPKSLEQDLVRTAAYTGLSYSSSVARKNLPHGEAIIFWESGFSPIKKEKNLFFALNRKGKRFFFQSDDLLVPIDYDFSEDDPDFDPKDVGIIRLAFPYYVARQPVPQSAFVTHNAERKELQLIADINELAFQVERDNSLSRLGRDLLRIALKKITSLSVSEGNESLGLALDIIGAATEKADTRNWQSLPAQIYYVRIPLKKGMNTIQVNNSEGTIEEFNIEGNGQMAFRNVVTY